MDHNMLIYNRTKDRPNSQPRNCSNSYAWGILYLYKHHRVVHNIRGGDDDDASLAVYDDDLHGLHARRHVLVVHHVHQVLRAPQVHPVLPLLELPSLKLLSNLELKEPFSY